MGKFNPLPNHNKTQRSTNYVHGYLWVDIYSYPFKSAETGMRSRRHANPYVFFYRIFFGEKYVKRSFRV